MVAVAYREGAAYVGSSVVIPCAGIEDAAEGVRIIGATRDGSPIIVKGGYVETSLSGVPMPPRETGIEIERAE